MKPVENAAQQAQELEGIVPTVNLAAEEGRKDSTVARRPSISRRSGACCTAW